VLTATRLEHLLGAIDELPRPVLTIWVRSDQPGAGGAGEAARVRVRQVVAGLGDELGEQLETVREHVLEALGGPAGAGTSMIFASQLDHDAPEVISRHFPLALPVGNRKLRAELRLGEPWLMPLRLAMGESERVGIIDVHEHDVALYETFLGEIEHVMTVAQPAMPGEHERGGSSHDDAEGHRVAWRHRFYVEVAEALEPMMAQREMVSMVLIGAPSDRYPFAEAVSRALRDKIFATGPALPRHDASPSEILAAVKEQIADHLRERRLVRIQQLPEHGVLGLSACLGKLQRGQLERLFVPWNLDAEIYVETETGYVGATPGQALAHSRSKDGRVRPAPAREELVRLADAYGATVEFTHTGASRSPFEEVQGVAGLLRWSEAERKTG
jgi:hypothetical protein